MNKQNKNLCFAGATVDANCNCYDCESKDDKDAECERCGFVDDCGFDFIEYNGEILCQNCYEEILEEEEE